MAKLVCQCLNREEFKNCLLFLKKNGVYWCTNEEIEVEKNLHELYDLYNYQNNVECMYIFLHKSYKKEDEFVISYSIKFSSSNGIFASLKNGLNMIGEEVYYVVTFDKFIKALTFYLKKWS